MYVCFRCWIYRNTLLVLNFHPHRCKGFRSYVRCIEVSKLKISEGLTVFSWMHFDQIILTANLLDSTWAQTMYFKRTPQSPPPPQKKKKKKWNSWESISFSTFDLKTDYEHIHVLTRPLSLPKARRSQCLMEISSAIGLTSNETERYLSKQWQRTCMRCAQWAVARERKVSRTSDPPPKNCLAELKQIVPTGANITCSKT